MRVLQLAPLYQPLRRDMTYGSIERLVMLLDGALTAAGHESIVVALNGSRVSGELISVSSDAGYVGQVRRAVDLAGAVDVIQVHRREFFDLGAADWIGLRFPAVRVVATLHGPPGRIRDCYARHASKAHFVFVSQAQARGLPELAGTVVRNAIDVVGVPFRESPALPAFVSFVGRVCDEKGVADAIDLAAARGWHLKIAGLVQETDRTYFETAVAPRLVPDKVEFVGPVNDEAKYRLVGGSSALILLPKYEDPCPLVVMEALATGTPVLGLARGGLPELITDGVTGLIASDVQSLLGKVAAHATWDRRACRVAAEQQFDVSRMVGEYERVYRGISAPSSAS
jgi:glycosyltransferase involved in cell wall biosynthesis